MAEKVEAAFDPAHDECCGAYVGSWLNSDMRTDARNVRFWGERTPCFMNTCPSLASR